MERYFCLLAFLTEISIQSPCGMTFSGARQRFQMVCRVFCTVVSSCSPIMAANFPWVSLSRSSPRADTRFDQSDFVRCQIVKSINELVDSEFQSGSIGITLRLFLQENLVNKVYERPLLRFSNLPNRDLFAASTLQS